ncbi:mandibular organ-inhibiting hormone-like [Penaeus japonicus]|uniref:mandibular organ-inhibiting hormone-like n=1 Tax=Penaeus japonicus TaxID=27405 RepID=UPI001C717547|nr:mandibular organ-inhibiting hormone-like [Penaeus japonicus]
MAEKHPSQGDKIWRQFPETRTRSLSSHRSRRKGLAPDVHLFWWKFLAFPSASTFKMVLPKALSSDKCFQKRLVLFLALIVCQHGYASFIKVRPNTLREFQYLNCQGEFNKAQYISLSHVCEDCHNLYRQPEILTECKANCFQNTLFPTCVSLLMLERHEEELNKKVALISGQEL